MVMAVSERRACRAVGQHRSTQRRPVPPNPYRDRLVARSNRRGCGTSRWCTRVAGGGTSPHGTNPAASRGLDGREPPDEASVACGAAVGAARGTGESQDRRATSFTRRSGERDTLIGPPVPRETQRSPGSAPLSFPPFRSGSDLRTAFTGTESARERGSLTAVSHPFGSGSPALSAKRERTDPRHGAFRWGFRVACL